MSLWTASRSFLAYMRTFGRVPGTGCRRLIETD
jgi:hypothetical protein